MCNHSSPKYCSHGQPMECWHLHLFQCALKLRNTLSLFPCANKGTSPLVLCSNKGTLAFVLVPMPHCTNLYNRTHVWLMHCLDGHSQSSDHVPKILMLWVRKKMMVLLYLVRHTLQILTTESKWDIVVACPLNGDQTFSSFGTSTSLTNSHPLANSQVILMEGDSEKIGVSSHISCRTLLSFFFWVVV